MRRKVFLFLFLVVVLWPMGGVGAVSLDLKPQLNPICWKKADCAAARVKFGKDVTNPGDGWLQNEAPCKDDSKLFGKCLPSGVTETSIKFGGQSKFNDLGEFFKLNYNYLLGIAGILSTFMIIIGAAQYVTSGGSSEAIGSAKKRIAGALVGLLIAYLSYVILTTINPALTNLRLPQVFMLNTQNVVPQFCSGVTEGNLMEIPAGTDPDAIKDLDNIKYNIPNSKKGELTCGHKYLVEGGGASACMGDTCEGAVGTAGSGGTFTCAPFTAQALNSGNIKNSQPGCIKGQLIVEYKFDNSLESLFEKVKQNIPLAGLVIQQVKDPWLSKTEENDDWVNSICANNAGSQFSPVRQKDDGSKKWKMMWFDVGKNHYVKIYDNIVGNESPAELDTFWCDNKPQTLKGFIISNHVDINYETADNYIHLGVKSGKGVFGKWNEDVDGYNFITTEQIKKGKYLLAEINTDILLHIFNCPDQDIDECCDGHEKADDQTDRFESCRNNYGGD